MNTNEFEIPRRRRDNKFGSYFKRKRTTKVENCIVIWVSSVELILTIVIKIVFFFFFLERKMKK